MARKKEKPKPLFGLKHDFYASLDNVLQESIMLIQAVEIAIRHEAVKGPAREALNERAAAMRKALMADEEGDA